MAKRPNFILLLADQQRADTLPCYGNRFVEAPYLDRMAAEGLCFTNCRTVFPVCTPARASMWTGIYPHAHGIIRNVYGENDLLGAHDLTSRSLFQHLKNHDYECAYYGKWHLGEDNPGPFDIWESFNSLGGHWVDSLQNFQGGTYIPDQDTDKMIDWFRNRRNDNPFAAVMSFYPPHDPFSSPLDCMDKYRRLGVPFPGYYGSVTALDRCVGRIWAALEESDLLDDTILIYYADHGETFHARDGVSSKFVCTEDGVHVPFLMMWRGHIPAGKRSSALIGLQDLMPTILDYAGIERPDGLHGESLRTLTEGSGEAAWRQSYYIENETHDLLEASDQPVRPRIHERALCTHRFKLVVNVEDEAPRLYDMRSDPEERVDLVGRRHNQAIAGTLAPLLTALEDHARTLDDEIGINLAQKHLRAMQAH